MLQHLVSPGTGMSAPAPVLTIVPLAPDVPVPRPATARTRVSVPAGYGVQEQCLPFTAASALGVLIPSPIRFGFCIPEQLPDGCRAFRSPLNRPAADGSHAEPRVFYVFDNPDCRFAGNAWEFKGVSDSGSPATSVQEPGLSFFDRDDQANLIKLHLPYIWRTPEAVDTLFLPLLNRPAPKLEVKCGLVETDWYASPVNLALAIPPGPLHVAAGELVAQAIFVPRALRRPGLDVVAEHTRASRGARKALAVWDRQHAEDRSIYKLLARSAHGRPEKEKPPEGHPIAQDRTD
ncbi:MAG: hypothetical protein QOH32_3097 [Bradyrhizobium sp.]|jgi:hypothetical protein|nr:hypothetical protein [Bradyrhizobium sp.]